MDIQDFVKRNAKLIKRVAWKEYKTKVDAKDYDELEMWVYNDEYLYGKAKAAGVEI